MALKAPLLPAILMIHLLIAEIIITLINLKNVMKSYSVFLNSVEHVHKAEFRDNDQFSPHGECC